MEDLHLKTSSMNAAKLSDIFQIASLTEYSDYTPLRDTQAGFSVQREYPATIRYKPPTTRDGRPDTVALIWVAYGNPAGSNHVMESEKMPIFVSIGPFSRHLSGRIGYDFRSPDCPTKESIKKSRRTPRPIDLESSDEYFYDYKNGQLQDCKGRLMSGQRILDTLFRKHCDTVHLFKGLRLRFQLGSRNYAVKILGVLTQTTILALRFSFGRTLEHDDPTETTWKPYDKDEMKLTQTEYVEKFGIRVSKRVILTFCILILVLAILTQGFSAGFFSYTKVSPLIESCFALVILWILDHPVPYMLLFLVNCCIRLKLRVLFVRFRV